MNPLVSFVTPMKEQDFRVIKLLRSIRSQNYPRDKVEIIITDGGSNPKVLEECKQYGVKIYHNPRGFAEGAGMGKDQGIWRAKGEFVVIAESDIELIGKNWITNMIKPLVEDKEIFGVVPMLFIHPKDNLTNKYLSYVGVDPFASNRAIEGNITIKGLNKIKKYKKQGYSILELDEKRPYCMGSNGFMFRKSLIKEVGDYAQDVEFIARLVKAGYKKFAVVESSRIWHKNVKGFNHFLKKRLKWTKDYTEVYIGEKKDFQWIDSRSSFFLYVLKNILFFPNIPISIKKAIEYRDNVWLVHPFFMFLSTAINIYFSLGSKQVLEQVF